MNDPEPCDDGEAMHGMPVHDGIDPGDGWTSAAASQSHKHGSTTPTGWAAAIPHPSLNHVHNLATQDVERCALAFLAHCVACIPEHMPYYELFASQSGTIVLRHDRLKKLYMFLVVTPSF